MDEATKYLVLNVIIWGLITIRILGLMSIAPFFAGFNIPMSVRFTISAWFGFLLLPHLRGSVIITDIFSIYTILVYALREFFVGYLMGIVMGFPFIAVQMAGRIYGMQMGFGMMNILDPYMQQQVSIMGQFKFLIALWFFLHWDGHILLLKALVKSFDYMPVASFVFNPDAVKEMISFVGRLFEVSMLVALPIAGSLLLADIGLGFVARTVPQMNIFVLGFPLKIIVGMMLLMAVLPLVVDVIHSYIGDSIKQMLVIVIKLGRV